MHAKKWDKRQNSMIKKQRLSLDEVVPGETYEECLLLYSADRIRIDSVKFKNCEFQQTDFSDSEWLDCQLEKCHFLNNDFTSSVFYRTTFEKCQLMGVDFSNNQWKNTLVTNSKADYINPSGSKIENSQFEKSSLIGSYFQDVTIKKSLKFLHCELDKTDFLGTSLLGVNISSSYFETMNVTTDQVRGCIISPQQAIAFVSLLGVKINNDVS